MNQFLHHSDFRISTHSPLSPSKKRKRFEVSCPTQKDSKKSSVPSTSEHRTKELLRIKPLYDALRFLRICAKQVSQQHTTQPSSTQDWNFSFFLPLVSFLHEVEPQKLRSRHLWSCLRRILQRSTLDNVGRNFPSMLCEQTMRFADSSATLPDLSKMFSVRYLDEEWFVAVCLEKQREGYEQDMRGHLISHCRQSVRLGAVCGIVLSERGIRFMYAQRIPAAEKHEPVSSDDLFSNDDSQLALSLDDSYTIVTAQSTQMQWDGDLEDIFSLLTQKAQEGFDLMNKQQHPLLVECLRQLSAVPNSVHPMCWTDSVKCFSFQTSQGEKQFVKIKSASMIEHEWQILDQLHKSHSGRESCIVFPSQSLALPDTSCAALVYPCYNAVHCFSWEDFSLSELHQTYSSLRSTFQSLHKQGFMHCDLKLCNLVMDEKKRVMLIDFDYASKTSCAQFTNSPYYPRTDLTFQNSPPLEMCALAVLTLQACMLRNRGVHESPVAFLEAVDLPTRLRFVPPPEIDEMVRTLCSDHAPLEKDLLSTFRVVSPYDAMHAIMQRMKQRRKFHDSV